MAILPEWWHWEVSLSAHVRKRMIDRNFNETDLRQMLTGVVRVVPDTEPDRWIAACRFERAAWEVVLEPMPDEQRTLVITAYRLD